MPYRKIDLLYTLLLLSSWFLPCFLYSQAAADNPFAKVKVMKPALEPLPLSAVSPGGWLAKELRKNMNGFTGYLDSLVPDLVLQDDIYGKDRLSKNVKSKNLGAVAEAGDWQVQYLWWNSETQSNWLDGYIRTAILLQDNVHLQHAENIINRLLGTQDKDGYIGIYDKELRYRFTNENGELWSKATLYRALLGWYEYKKDKQILVAVEKAVSNVMQAWPPYRSHPFFSVNPNAGGLTHGLAFTDVLEHLYRLTKKQQYLDYCLFMYKDFSEQVLNEDAQLPKLLDRDLPLKGHGVHTYEHLRSVTAAYYASGNRVIQKALDNFLLKIKKVTTPSGGPVSDEFILGREANGSLGYEFCSLQELLAGWISLVTKSAATPYAASAEHLLFNAALGNTHPAESAICYLKQDNAFYLTGGNNGDTSDKHQTRYRYSPVHKEAAVCCVPNAGRIFPTYVQNMWMKDKEGLVAVLLGPAKISTTFKNVQVSVNAETEYPFENTIRFTVSCQAPARFSLKIRKPDWAIEVRSSLPFTEKNGYLVFEKLWGSSADFSVSFTSRAVKKETAGQEIYYESGPLVLCHVIASQPGITKEFNIHGLKEFVEKPVQPVLLQYDTGRIDPVPGVQNTFSTTLYNRTSGKTEEVILVPMARTILRQVTFPKRQ